MSDIDTKMAKLRELARPLSAKLVEGGLKALLIDGLIDSKHFKQVVSKVAINFNDRTLAVTGHDGTVLETYIDVERYLGNAL